MLTVTRRQLSYITRAYQAVMLVLTVASILLVGTLMGSTAVSLITMLGFLGARQLVENPYHCTSLVKCLFISVLTFSTILRLAPSPSFSLSAGPILASLVAYGSSYVPKYAQYRQFYIEQHSFDIDNPSVADMRARCTAKNFTAEETDICIKLFCKQGTRKLSAKEYMSLVGASDEWTARNIKSAYKKRLM